MEELYKLTQNIKSTFCFSKCIVIVEPWQATVHPHEIEFSFKSHKETTRIVIYHEKQLNIYGFHYLLWSEKHGWKNEKGEEYVFEHDRIICQTGTSSERWNEYYHRDGSIFYDANVIDKITYTELNGKLIDYCEGPYDDLEIITGIVNKYVNPYFKQKVKFFSLAQICCTSVCVDFLNKDESEYILLAKYVPLVGDKLIMRLHIKDDKDISDQDYVSKCVEQIKILLSNVPSDLINLIKQYTYI